MNTACPPHHWIEIDGTVAEVREMEDSTTAGRAKGYKSIVTMPFSAWRCKHCGRTELFQMRVLERQRNWNQSDLKALANYAGF